MSDYPRSQCANTKPHAPHAWNAIDPAARFRTGENEWRLCGGVSDHTQIGIPIVHDSTEDAEEPWQARVPMGPQPTHLAIPLDAESLARLREIAVLAVMTARIVEKKQGNGAIADAVLAALGLEPA